MNYFKLKILVLLSLAIFSCEKYEDKDVNEEIYKSSRKSEFVKLGKKLENAYSVSNFTEAYKIYNELTNNDSNYLRVASINATHKYIKFMPQTEDELVILDSISKGNNIILSEYPLDYEILEDGSAYNDPSYVGDEQFKPLYAVVPINYNINVNNQILEEVHEPTEDEFDVETIALSIANWQQDLIADFGTEVTLDNVQNFIGNNERASRKFTPNGFVRVFVYDNGSHEGLMNAKINVGRGIWWHSTLTNSDGYFVANKSYRGKVRVRSAWRNTTATLRMSRAEMAGVDVSDHIYTLTRGNNGSTYVIFNSGDDSRLWYKGVVNNSYIRYNNYCNVTNNINKIQDSNTWVIKEGDAASTPMMNRYPIIPVVTAINSWSLTNFWRALLINVGLSQSQTFLPASGRLMPDQIMAGLSNSPYYNNNNTLVLQQSNKVIQQKVFHETAHFSHATRIGGNSYAKIVAAELINSYEHNDPYYNGISPTTANGLNIALAEGWATFMEEKCMSYYYNHSYDFGRIKPLPEYIDTYTMYTLPYSVGLGRNKQKGWFLTGIMWDICDIKSTNEFNSFLVDGQNETRIVQIVDNLFIGDNADRIFRLLNNVESGYALKSKLLTEYPQLTSEINELFKTYGY